MSGETKSDPLADLVSLIGETRDLGAGLGAVGLADDASADELLAFCRMVAHEPIRIANELQTILDALRAAGAALRRRGHLQVVEGSP